MSADMLNEIYRFGISPDTFFREMVTRQDGSDKNDCERNAARLFFEAQRREHPHLKLIVTEDALSSNAPHVEDLQ